MNDIKDITLSNGLRLLLLQDKNKNRTTGTIYINAGGLNNKYKYDNKNVEQVYGIAHFLEHYLLEKSMYGNIMNYFDNEYISSNGITSNNRTKFYISTVHDFEDNFIKLINVVNNPSFNKDDIEDVKKPILSEIQKSNDQPHKDFFRYTFESVFKNIGYDKTLGSTSDIRNMTIEDIELFHNAFYQPSNQMIVVTGNFKEKEIIKLIEDEYNKIKRDYKKVIKEEIKEPAQVVRERGTFKDETEERLSISYKVDVSKYSPIDKNKIDYYFHYLLSNNFSEKTEIFKYIRDNKLSVYSPNYGYEASITKDYIIIHLDLTTSKFKEAEELLMNKFSNMDIDEESFIKWKNKSIIKIINLSEKVDWKAENLVNNINYYDLYQVDSIDFVKDLNIKELKEFINKLDFSNYSIVNKVGE